MTSIHPAYLMNISKAFYIHQKEECRALPGSSISNIYTNFHHNCFSVKQP